jgi:hypothetical protein
MPQTRRQFLEITALGGGLLATLSLPGLVRAGQS